MPYVKIRDGRIESVKLEYNVVDHCNFSCDECSHLSPYMRPNSPNLDRFAEDLHRLAEVYSVERFRFVGGEPLLNRDIVDFVDCVRESGIARQIEVVTNGALGHKVSDSLFRSIDILSVTRYPDPRVDDDKIASLESRARSSGTKFRVESVNRFRRMQTARNDDDESVTDIYRSCLIAHTWYCQTFYDGYFYLCSRPIYTDEFLRRTGSAGVDLRKADGIALHQPRLLERLLAALQATQPLSACRYCLGTVGRSQPWRSLPATERRRPGPPAVARDGISVSRLKSLLAWRRLESAVLDVLPSVKLARAFAASLTAIVGD